MQRPAITKEIDEVKSKREELMKFLQPTPNVATATTTDSDDERWEEQIGTTCSMPRQLVGTEKSDNTRLVDITSQKDETMGAMAEKTITELATIGETNIVPQQEITKGRLLNTPSTADIPTLAPSHNTVDFKTPASHKASTPVEQRLDEEFNRLLLFEEHESNKLAHEAEEQSASQDNSDDEDADTESLYEPAREITPVPPRQNPERARRKSERYGLVDVNVITTSSSNNNQLRRGGSTGLKLWQLGLLLICCLIIPVGQASPNKTIGRRNSTTGRAQVSWPQLISMKTMRWKSASPWIEYSFGLTTGILLGFSIIMIIGLIIMRRQGARLQRVG